MKLLFLILLLLSRLCRSEIRITTEAANCITDGDSENGAAGDDESCVAPNYNEEDDDDDTLDDSSHDDSSSDYTRILQDDDHPYWSMIVAEMWQFYKCSDIFSSPRPAHNESTWSYMRGVYVGLSGGGESSLSIYNSGFQVPVEIRAADDKGRGVFAAERPIPNNQLVWSSQHTARFDSGETYRHFLALIPRELACDVLQWAYVTPEGGKVRYTEDGDYDPTSLRICVDLDSGSFMNEEDEEGIGNPDQPANIVASPSKTRACEVRLFAKRDIEVGEELICDYGEFAVKEGWFAFDLW
jgi:hypothetical protein